MNRVLLPIKSIIRIGLFNGLFFVVTMATFDYVSNEPLSIPKFLFHAFFFGLAMAIAFRYKYTKKEQN